MTTQTKKANSQKTTNKAATQLPDPNLRYQIEKRAHEIWLLSGCSHGEDVAHWLQAENEMMSKSPIPPAK
jgi:hypothetical protein